MWTKCAQPEKAQQGFLRSGLFPLEPKNVNMDRLVVKQPVGQLPVCQKVSPSDPGIVSGLPQGEVDGLSTTAFSGPSVVKQPVSQQPVCLKVRPSDPGIVSVLPQGEVDEAFHNRSFWSLSSFF